MAPTKQSNADGEKSLFDIFKKVKRQGNYRRKIKKIIEAHKQSDKVKPIESEKNIEEMSSVLQAIDLFSSESVGIDAQNEFNLDDVAVENWMDFDQDENESNFNGDPAENQTDYSEIREKFYQKLSEWAHSCHPTQHQIRQLLKVCNETLPFEIPRDPRTVMGTPRSVTIINFDGSDGQYWHHGLNDALHRVLKNVRDLPPKISLNFNIDGLPISESSAAQFWPILCNIHEIHQIEPIVIGIYAGTSKYKYNNYSLT